MLTPFLCTSSTAVVVFLLACYFDEIHPFWTHAKNFARRFLTRMSVNSKSLAKFLERVMSDIKAVIFDYGGVLAEEGFSNGLQALAREQKLAVDNMTAEGMRAVYDSGFVLGKGSAADFWSLLRERTGLRGRDQDLKRRILEGFVLRPAMLELAEKLRSSGYVTAILSDQTDWLDELDQRDHFYHCFDRIYNSYYSGKGKRDPSHFSDVAKDLNIPPSSIVFVDDSAANVATAAGAGMLAIQYINQTSFIKRLNELLPHDVQLHGP
jgi:putative hydrolase of the HAD superfamily